MLYLTSMSARRLRDLAPGRDFLGMMTTPRVRYRVFPDIRWAADNACGPGRGGAIAPNYPGDERWHSWLMRHASGPELPSCMFAVVPDVVGDADATLRRFRVLSQRVRSLGYPVALAAQNGLRSSEVPWDEISVLFIGGDTAWKLGRDAADLCLEARERGLFVHFGRVNSEKRIRHAIAVGATSADGTYLKADPHKNLPRLEGWFARMPKRQPPHVQFGLPLEAAS